MKRVYQCVPLAIFLALGCHACGGDGPAGLGDHGAPNQPPVILDLTPDPLLVDPTTGRTTVTVSANDPDGDQLRYLWSASSGTISGSGPSIEWGAPSESDFYAVTVSVTDSRGGVSSASVEVAVRGFTLLVGSEKGVLAFDEEGNMSPRFPTHSYRARIEVLGLRLFFAHLGRGIEEHHHAGESLQQIPQPAEIDHLTDFTALPDGRFAILDNAQDVVAVIDSTGAVLHRTGLGVAPNDHLQNMHGELLGDRLLISETGDQTILELDLNTMELSVFRDFKDTCGWLGDITRAGDHYYLARPYEVMTFTAEGPASRVLSIHPEYWVAGMAVVGRHLYVTVNHAGKILRADLETGEVEVFAEGLDHPMDIEFYPVALR